MQKRLILPQAERLAMLNGKTRMSRVCKEQPSENFEICCVDGHWEYGYWGYCPAAQGPSWAKNYDVTPPFQPGDLLYLAEPYEIASSNYHSQTVYGHYLDDDKFFDIILTEKEWVNWNVRTKPYSKTPARFMYKSLARHWFEVEAVGCQQNDGVWEWVYTVKKVEVKK